MNQATHIGHHNRPTIDFAGIAREAIPALAGVLSRILPGGRVIGREYVVLNPRRADRRPTRNTISAPGY